MSCLGDRMRKVGVVVVHAAETIVVGTLVVVVVMVTQRLKGSGI